MHDARTFVIDTYDQSDAGRTRRRALQDRRSVVGQEDKMVTTTSRLCLCAGLLLLAVSRATASVGADIVYCTNHPGPARFSWSVPGHATDRQVVVVSPQGEALLYWTKDVPPLDEYVFWERVEDTDFEAGHIRFSLSEVGSGDGGRYTCREGDLTGPVIPDCGQTLHYIEIRKPIATGWGLNVEGQQGKVVCMFQLPFHWGYHGLEFYFEWFKDGRLVPGQRDFVLKFSSIKRSDEGLYACRVSEASRNCATSVESGEHFFKIAYSPSVRILDHHHGVIKVTEGSHVTLTCEVVSAFPPVPSDGYSWSFSPSDSSPARPLPHTGDTLTLGPVTREDSGQYTCQARNDQDSDEKISPGQDSINVSVVYMQSITTTPELEVADGETATLTCLVHSNPTATVTWVRGGTVLRSVTANQNRLVLKTVSGSDSDSYTCQATNSELPNVIYQSETLLRVKLNPQRDLERRSSVQHGGEREENMERGHGAYVLPNLRLPAFTICIAIMVSAILTVCRTRHRH